MSRKDDRAHRLLREANPLTPEEAPAPTSPRGEALFQRIISSPRTEAKKPFWRRRGALIVLVPAAALAIAGGYALVNRASDPLNVICFQEPSLSSHRTQVSLQGDDLLSACRPLWDPGEQYNPEGRTPAPPLAACLLQGGELAVFPEVGDGDTCTALGLEVATGGEIGEEHRAIQAVQEELFAHFMGTCVAREEATALVKQSLRRHGLVGWRVDAAGQFTTNRPCATLAYNFPGRTITLVPTSSERSS
jgi:hypothetical protein